MTNARKIRTSVENHSSRRDCNGLKLHTNGVSASHKLVAKADRDEVMELPRLSFWLKLDKQDTEIDNMSDDELINEQAQQEFDVWMDGQIAEQRAFEARIDMMIK